MKFRKFTPIIFIIIIIFLLSFLWYKIIFQNYFLNGQFDKAGQIGDSFGIFNFFGLIIIAITLIYQIFEYNANRSEMKKSVENQNLILQNEIKYNKYSKIYDSLIKEFDRYNDLYLQYLTIFEEINAGKTHNISLENLVRLSTGMFQRFFIRITKNYNQYMDDSFEYKGIEFDKIGPDESISSKGTRVFNNIKENLDSFFQIINKSFDNNSSIILKNLNDRL